MVNTVNILYSPDTRIIQYESASAVSVSGDANSTTLHFIIPESHAQYAKYIEFDMKLEDEEGNLVSPIYLLDGENSFTLPQEITANAQNRLVLFNLKFTNSEGYVERSLQLSIYINKSVPVHNQEKYFEYMTLVNEEATARIEEIQNLHTSTVQELMQVQSQLHQEVLNEMNSRIGEYEELLGKFTDGSVTKVGVSTVGSSSSPIYLNNGVPTACIALTDDIDGIHTSITQHDNELLEIQQSIEDANSAIDELNDKFSEADGKFSEVDSEINYLNNGLSNSVLKVTTGPQRIINGLLLNVVPDSNDGAVNKTWVKANTLSKDSDDIKEGNLDIIGDLVVSNANNTYLSVKNTSDDNTNNNLIGMLSGFNFVDKNGVPSCRLQYEHTRNLRRLRVRFYKSNGTYSDVILAEVSE